MGAAGREGVFTPQVLPQPGRPFLCCALRALPTPAGTHLAPHPGAGRGRGDEQFLSSTGPRACTESQCLSAPPFGRTSLSGPQRPCDLPGGEERADPEGSLAGGALALAGDVPGRKPKNHCQEGHPDLGRSSSQDRLGGAAVTNKPTTSEPSDKNSHGPGSGTRLREPAALTGEGVAVSHCRGSNCVPEEGTLSPNPEERGLVWKWGDCRHH